MERARLNYWIDILLLICFIVVGTTGLILKFVFVSGVPGAGRTVSFLGLHKVDILPWHELFGVGMVVLIVIHLVLHFGWLTSMTKSLFESKD